jgi:hypothetical protein
MSSPSTTPTPWKRLHGRFHSCPSLNEDYISFARLELPRKHSFAFPAPIDHGESNIPPRTSEIHPHLIGDRQNVIEPSPSRRFSELPPPDPRVDVSTLGAGNHEWSVSTATGFEHSTMFEREESSSMASLAAHRGTRTRSLWDRWNQNTGLSETVEPILGGRGWSWMDDGATSIGGYDNRQERNRNIFEEVPGSTTTPVHGSKPEVGPHLHHFAGGLCGPSACVPQSGGHDSSSVGRSSWAQPEWSSGDKIVETKSVRGVAEALDALSSPDLVEGGWRREALRGESCHKPTATLPGFSQEISDSETHHHNQSGTSSAHEDNNGPRDLDSAVHVRPMQVTLQRTPAGPNSQTPQASRGLTTYFRCIFEDGEEYRLLLRREFVSPRFDAFEEILRGRGITIFKDYYETPHFLSFVRRDTVSFLPSFFTTSI